MNRAQVVPTEHELEVEGVKGRIWLAVTESGTRFQLHVFRVIAEASQGPALEYEFPQLKRSGYADSAVATKLDQALRDEAEGRGEEVTPPGGPIASRRFDNLGIACVEDGDGHRGVAIVLGDIKEPHLFQIGTPEQLNGIIRDLDEARASLWPASRGVVRS